MASKVSFVPVFQSCVKGLQIVVLNVSETAKQLAALTCLFDAKDQALDRGV